MRPGVRQWVAKADRDYRTAETLAASLTRDLYESTGFHAQQCIEKYAKAFLTQAGIPFYKIHDLTVPGRFGRIPLLALDQLSIVKDDLSRLQIEEVIRRFGAPIHHVEEFLILLFKKSDATF